MTNFTFIKNTIQEIDEAFREEGFTAIERLINSLNPPNISQPSGQTLNPTIGDFEKTTRGQNYDILLDSGSGRVSRGLNSLQSLSRIIAGKSAIGIKTLSNKIIYSNEKELKQANKTTLRTIVLRNLGIESLIEPASQDNAVFVNSTLAVIDQLGNDVQKGIFNIRTYKKEIITRSKALVNMANASTLKTGNVT